MKGKVLGVAVAVGAVAWYLLNSKNEEKAKEAAAAAAAEPKRMTKEWQDFQLIEKRALTTEVACPVSLFRFKLPKDESLQLPVGQHIALRCTNPATGKPHQRSYTPTSTNQDLGFFDLVVKIYPTGVLGQHLSKMHVGDTILAKGPAGRFTYEANKFDDICMIAGGSGITPMYQIAMEVARLQAEGKDDTKVSMLVGNQTEQDIILPEELEQLDQTPSIKVTHVITTPQNKDYKGEKGFISADLIKANCPPADSGKRLKVLLCGPPPMLDAMKKILEELGYSQEQIFRF